MGGRVGTDTFVILSGYFLVKSSRIKPQRLAAMTVKMCFYAVSVFLLLVLRDPKIISSKTRITAFLLDLNGNWWFIKTYLVLYILHPYINVMLNNLSREDYRKFLVTLWVCWCIFPTITGMRWEASDLTNFISIYCLAGYFRLWAEDFGSKKYIFFGFMFMMADLLTVIILDVAGLWIPVFGRNALYFRGMMRPFTSMSALCFLLGFRKLDMTYSKVINVIASATLGVYLLHENPFSTRFLWHGLFRVELYRYSNFLIVYSVFVVICMYIMCALVELLRSKIFKTLSRGRLS